MEGRIFPPLKIPYSEKSWKEICERKKALGKFFSQEEGGIMHGFGVLTKLWTLIISQE